MIQRPRSPEEAAADKAKRRRAWEDWRDRALARLRATDPQGAAVLEAMFRSWSEGDAAEPTALVVGVGARFAAAPPPGPGA